MCKQLSVPESNKSLFTKTAGGVGFWLMGYSLLSWYKDQEMKKVLLDFTSLRQSSILANCLANLKLHQENFPLDTLIMTPCIP